MLPVAYSVLATPAPAPNSGANSNENNGGISLSAIPGLGTLTKHKWWVWLLVSLGGEPSDEHDRPHVRAVSVCGDDAQWSGHGKINSSATTFACHLRVLVSNLESGCNLSGWEFGLFKYRSVSGLEWAS